MVKTTDITVILRCKVAVCGDAAVGKTSLISVFNSKAQKFPQAYNMTSGVDISVVPVNVPESTANVELYLYDTAGNEIYMEPASSCWNGIYWTLLVYDVTNPESFNNCKKWLDLLKQSRPDKDHPLAGAVVATKMDAPLQRHLVAASSAQEFASSNGLEFFEVSSLPPGKDYEAPFMFIAKSLYKSYEDKVKSYLEACRNY